MPEHPPSPSSVIGVVFSKDLQQVLLVKRRDVPAWVLPGGGIDPNETAEAAAVREVFEESGLNVAIVRQAALYTPINKLAKVTATFVCEVKGGTLTTGAETAEVAFFPLDALPKSLFFLHRQWLEDAKKGSGTVIQRRLTQVTYGHFLCYFCRHPIQVVRLLLSRLGFPINR